MVPLLLSLGGVVDLAMLQRDRFMVQAALDAAALAAAKHYPLDTTDAGLTRVAQMNFDANTSALARTTASMRFEGTGMTASGDRQVRLSSCTTYDPVFLKLAPISFPGLVGSACARAESDVIVSMTAVEIALVLDTSGSMNSAPATGGSTKISTLKTVAVNAVETLFGGSSSTGDVDPVKMAVVPFSGGVNVGPSYLDAWWMDPKGQSPIHHENFDWSTYRNPLTGLADAVKSTLYPGAWTMISSPTTFLTRQHIYKKLGSVRSSWSYKGCVESRPAPYGITDVAPDSAKPSTLFVPYFAPDESDQLNATWTNSFLSDSATSNFSARTKDVRKYYAPSQHYAVGSNYHFSPSWLCDSNPLLPLTTAKSQALSAVSALVATGSTNVAQGVEWGWHVLSKNEPFATGKASGDESVIKAMIVMTDGEHTYYQDSYNSAANNPNLSAFGAYGFTATNRIFDYKAGVSTTKSNDNYTLAMDGRLAAICENAKKDGQITLEAPDGSALVDEKGTVKRDGIVIYTIAFDIPAASKTRVDALLKECASYTMGDLRDTTKPYSAKAKYFYSASSSAELTKAFGDIMATLSSTRVAR
ncbi:pilus assembly protein TadG-related protein [Antarcticirhabdus aurantiaca]|uniref:Pilus assembly protein TadG-related protein n=2 Tax=Antarcticirhabdus aurantiaca TaxID=2606717 RepID=A0ACD4NLZ5_9HYPH|nr:pilus assembly protein TadG-related protein [Jeongeuplla avenae]